MQRLSTPSRALFAPAAVMAAILFGATAVACDDEPTVPKPPTYVTTMNGASEVPPKTVAGTGSATIVKSGTTYTYTITYTGMTGQSDGCAHPRTGRTGSQRRHPRAVHTAHGRRREPPARSPARSRRSNNARSRIDSLDVLMTNGNAYVNLHTACKPGGEIRGQLSQQP